MKSLGKEQQFFKVFDNASAKATNVSFQISRKITASGKCFTDREFVKKCMLLAVSELCEKVHAASCIRALSRKDADVLKH